MSPLTRVLTVAALALPGTVLAQPDDAFGIGVVRGPAIAEVSAGLVSETEIDPSGLSAPITITRGRVRPAPLPAPETATCDCDRPDTRVVVVIRDGGFGRFGRFGGFGVWSPPGRPLHNVWYSWMRSYQLSLAAQLDDGLQF